MARKSKEEDKSSTSKQLGRFQFTLHGADVVKRVDEIKTAMKVFGKRWVFQAERGEETGKVHLQGRISLIQVRRITEMQKVIPGAHWSIEGPDKLKAEFYCMKEETRVAGPWSDRTEVGKIPKQLREVEELRPWQKSVIRISGEWDTRSINVIYDTDGNIGKSIVCTWMGVYRIGKKLPFCNDYKDIMRMAYDLGEQKCYIVDIPRAITKDKLFQMFAALEELKSGYAYDDRYEFKDRYFDSPQIWVFMNKLPDFSLLSLDRWKIWQVVEQELVVYGSGEKADKEEVPIEDAEKKEFLGAAL